MIKSLDKVVFLNPLIIKLNDAFKSAYKIDKKTLTNIAESIRANGFDKTFPLLLWSKDGSLIDGHTRRKAAIDAGLIRVPCKFIEADSEKEILEYIERIQLDRRNLSQKDKIELIINNPEFDKANNKKEFIKEKLHCSIATAGRLLSVINNPQKLQAVLKGDETVTAITTKADKSTSIERAAKKLTVLLQKAETLSAAEFKALDKLFTAGRRQLREMK